jgi:hypothetical protein
VGAAAFVAAKPHWTAHAMLPLEAGSAFGARIDGNRWRCRLFADLASEKVAANNPL